MSLEHERKHFPWLILISFILNFVASMASVFFPQYSYEQGFCWQLGSLFYIAGCCLVSVKLGSEKWHIASAGFIMLSIGQGILFLLQTSVADLTENGITNEVFREASAATLVLVPGYLFVCYYSGYPRWLRIMGVLSLVPFIAINVMLARDTYQFEEDMWIDGVGFGLQQITGIGWGYYSLKPFKKINVQQE